MAASQKPLVSSMSAEKSVVMGKAESGVADDFPIGLRVLVVDDDVSCLRILERMLWNCRYNVTSFSEAKIALSVLREKKGDFDIILSDVHMPDMDGFKLLEHVGLEMGLPVIMMSADGSTSAVMRGIKHGACDYLLKPVRKEELKNIWQHVIRKKWNDNKELKHSSCSEHSERSRRVSDDAEYTSSINEGMDGSWCTQKKRKDTKDDDDGELDNDDPSASKKPRVVWSVDLHQQFVTAVNQLGIDKAVPKRILELMNVPGLTRENVASHLQKFRLYLKRLTGVAQHQSDLTSSFGGPVESNGKLGLIGRPDIQALAASGRISPQLLAALHAEVLGQPTGSFMMPPMDNRLVQTSLQESRCTPADRKIIFGHPLLKCQTNASKQFNQPTVPANDILSGMATWTPNHLDALASSGNIGVLNTPGVNSPLQPLQRDPSVLPEFASATNVQPSSLVVPSHSPHGFQTSIHTVPIHQDLSLPRSDAAANYSSLSSQLNGVFLGDWRYPDADVNNSVLSGSSICDGPVSPVVSSSSINFESSSGWQVQNSATHHVFDTFGSCTKTGIPPDQVKGGYLGFVGKGISIPTRFAGDDEMESEVDGLGMARLMQQVGDC